MPKKVTLPDTSFLTYTYDAAHRLTEIEDDEGNRIEYTLDAMGNRTAEEVYDPSSALVRTRTQVFNSLNRLWKQIGAAGTAAVTTVYGYDDNGNQTSIAAPLSRTTGQQYDELNRLLGDPVNLVDPSGTIFGVPGAIAGAIVGAVAGGFGAAATGGSVINGIVRGAIVGGLVGGLGPG